MPERIPAKTFILTLDAGPTKVKFALYKASGRLLDISVQGVILYSAQDSVFKLNKGPLTDYGRWKIDARDCAGAIAELLRWLEQHPSNPQLLAAGHRVIHGGDLFSRPVLLNRNTLRRLESISDLAPLHLPHNLTAMKVLSARYPALPQVACFDTAFHHDMPLVERHFAIPHHWQDLGVRQYGFHGLDFESITDVLPDYLGKKAAGRIIVAHLGGSTGLCALHDLRSVATTSSFSPLGGLPAATRSGAIDPAAILYLQKQGIDSDSIARQLNFASGLLGLSGSSGDMRTLLASHDPAARLAVDYFIHHTHRAIGSLTAALGGLDALIFTAGIGEHAPRIRQRLCDLGSWLGLKLDNEANVTGRGRISPKHSMPSVWVIPTDAKRVVAQHTIRLTHGYY